MTRRCAAGRSTDDTSCPDTVIAELVRHSVAEQMFGYPAMREHVPDGATHAALFHKTVGPGVGLVDKLRDALSGRDRNT